MHCHGVGRLAHNPVLKDVGEDKTCFVCHLNLVFSELINGNREKCLLPFSVWGTAAEYIMNNFKKGDLIEIIDSSAQNFKKSDVESKIVFRINKFNKVSSNEYNEID